VENCKYPAPLECAVRGISGNGFYPAASGVINDVSPDQGVMFLGRDWGSKKDYIGFCGDKGESESGPTWRRFEEFYLPEFLNVPIWCTNYLLGVRSKGAARGNIRKQIDEDEWNTFEGYCWDFLHAEVMLLRPRVLVVFGDYNKRDLRARFGITGSDTMTKFQFFQERKRHETRVTFTNHPYSFIGEKRQLAAVSKAEDLRALYEQELQASS